MSRAISLVLFVVVTMVSGNISIAKANDAEICYFHGVEHPAPSVPGGEIRLESAMLGGDNTPGANASVLYGILGALPVGLAGCIFGWSASDSWFDGDKRKICLIGGTILGAAIGGYAGSRVDSRDGKALVIIGAVGTVAVVALYLTDSFYVR